MENILSPDSAFPFRLAAIDLDGTLLGPDLSISGENLRALADLKEREVEIVIATGRHYESVRPFLKKLPGVQWIVSVQGGEVSDRDRRLILGRDFLPSGAMRAILRAAADRGITTMIYGVEGVCTFSPSNAETEFYSRLSGLTPRRVRAEDLEGMEAFKVLWLGKENEIDAIMAEGSFASEVEKVRTHLGIAEFVPAGISKASGLELLATRLGLRPEQCLAFGDSENDVPMFKWAGLAVAMDHSWPRALASAAVVAAPGAPQTALARGVEAALRRFPQVVSA